MTEEEWRAGILRRIDRLEKADDSMQKEIGEIKASIRESKIVIQSMDDRLGERLNALETRLQERQERSEKKVDDLISSFRSYNKAVWLMVVGGIVAYALKGGFVI